MLTAAVVVNRQSIYLDIQAEHDEIGVGSDHK